MKSQIILVNVWNFWGEKTHRWRGKWYLELQPDLVGCGSKRNRMLHRHSFVYQRKRNSGYCTPPGRAFCWEKSTEAVSGGEMERRCVKKNPAVDQCQNVTFGVVVSLSVVSASLRVFICFSPEWRTDVSREGHRMLAKGASFYFYYLKIKDALIGASFILSLSC